MHPNALLELATELTHRLLQFRAAADGVMSDFFREHRALGPRERHTLAETAYRVLRQKPLLEHLAQSGKGERERRLAILAWQGNAGFLKAALSADEQVWLDRVSQVDRSTLPAALHHNLPGWLADRLHAELGDGFAPLVAALEQPAPLDLRVNTFKARREAVQVELQAQRIDAIPTPYSPWGLRVDGKPPLHKVETFLRGDIEVQDEGSQLLAVLTDAKRGEMVADFCAGAGGKTLALGASMRNTGRLYAMDVSGHRLAALKPRLARSGLSNVYPIQIAHERDERVKRLAGKVDRVLIDAPCSGLGTLRRNPDLKWRHTPATVLELQAKQIAILSSAARLVKPGGRLVYATCSLLAEENERVCEQFEADAAGGRAWEPLPVDALLTKAGVEAAGDLVSGPADALTRYLRLWPHRHGTDGFFAAVWQRAS
jgi:16S rRNA (cytosine967-C5)-methyltransferase